MSRNYFSLTTEFSINIKYEQNMYRKKTFCKNKSSKFKEIVTREKNAQNKKNKLWVLYIEWYNRDMCMRFGGKECEQREKIKNRQASE